MNSRNFAIVSAPNLLRSLNQDIANEESLKDIREQAKVIECFIKNYPELFCDIGGLTSELPAYDLSIRSHKEQRKVESLNHHTLFTDLNIIKKRPLFDSVFPCPQNQGPFCTNAYGKPPHTRKVKNSENRQLFLSWSSLYAAKKGKLKIILQIYIACVDKEVSDHDRVTEYKIKMFTMTNSMFLNHYLFGPDRSL